MTGIIDKVKETFSSHSGSKADGTHTGAHTGPQPGSNNPEQQFSIQPHPAASIFWRPHTTNDPADLQRGLKDNSANVDAFHAHGPYVPGNEIKSSIPQPLSREELQVRQAALGSEVPGHGTQQGNIL